MQQSKISTPAKKFQVTAWKMIRITTLIESSDTREAADVTTASLSGERDDVQWSLFEDDDYGLNRIEAVAD